MVENKVCKIALDVMGTDNGPASIVQGGIEAARELGDRIKVLLVGRSDVITAELKKHA